MQNPKNKHLKKQWRKSLSWNPKGISAKYFLERKNNKDEKSPKRNSAKSINRATARHTVVLTSMGNHAQTHGRASQHGLTVPPHMASSTVVLLAVRAFRPCWTVVLPRVQSCVAPSIPIGSPKASFDLYYSFNSSYKLSFSVQTRGFSLEAQISHNMSINESKEANLSLSQSRFIIGIEINRNQIWVKRCHNRDLSLPHAYLLLVPKQDKIMKYQRGR